MGASDSAPAAGTARPVDGAALHRIRERLRRAAAAPWLHEEVARRMSERLPVIRLQPQTVLDWDARAGGGRSRLAAAYPRARIVGVEAAVEPAGAARWWSPRRWRGGAEPALAEAEVPPGAAQLLWANMMLHWVRDPQAQMRAWQRALAVDGCLMFSTLGPGSLEGLRAVYAARRWGPAHAPFVDMHDLGDMLLGAGFADPVMYQESLVLSWPDADALLAELRSLGANADVARAAGLRTPRWRTRLRDALASLCGPDGRPRLSFEVVYGHAFKPPPRPRVQAETAIAVDELRVIARRGRSA